MMYEENRRFSFTNFFIKAIIVIIFVLFTVWLLSLSNKGISNSLNVLTDNIFAENIDKMKEVGKEYFTIERLPEEVGDIKTLTLAKMYDKKLLLELKDKNGKACNAEDSYVSIEKMESEYQMKVYLECGKQSDYIIVIMGCYDYCDTDICELKKDETAKEIEYQYSKSTNGNWTDWGNWTEWSKVSVTKADYRDVETKVVNEKYTYDKTVTKNEYLSFNLSCPDGYTKTSDGTKCYKTTNKTEYANPNKCATTYNGYMLVSQDGFTCNYSKDVTTSYTKNPVCASTYNGYTYYGIDGLTCKYSKEKLEIASIDYVYSCDGTCSMKPVYTYKKGYSYTTASATCPSGTSPKNGTCVGYTTDTDETTTAVSCPVGYTKTSDGTKCYKNTSNTEYKNIIKICPVNTKETSDKTQCYKEVSSVVQVTGTKDVTYYRYRLRQYVGGTVDYKWSKSNNDKDLLNTGYKLTGKTR